MEDRKDTKKYEILRQIKRATNEEKFCANMWEMLSVEETTLLKKKAAADMKL